MLSQWASFFISTNGILLIYTLMSNCQSSDVHTQNQRSNGEKSNDERSMHHGSVINEITNKTSPESKWNQTLNNNEDKNTNDDTTSTTEYAQNSIFSTQIPSPDLLTNNTKLNFDGFMVDSISNGINTITYDSISNSTYNESLPESFSKSSSKSSYDSHQNFTPSYFPESPLISISGLEISTVEDRSSLVNTNTTPISINNSMLFSSKNLQSSTNPSLSTTNIFLLFTNISFSTNITSISNNNSSSSTQIHLLQSSYTSPNLKQLKTEEYPLFVNKSLKQKSNDTNYNSRISHTIALGVTLIDSDSHPYSFHRVAPAIELAIGVVNERLKQWAHSEDIELTSINDTDIDSENTSQNRTTIPYYQLLPVFRKYGPNCDAAQAPGLFINKCLLT